MRFMQFAVAGFLCICVAACVPDDSLKHRNGFVPETLSDNWIEDLPQHQQIDPAGLATAYEMLHSPVAFQNALALLVARNNRLVFETYTRTNADRDRLHHVQSTTKSFTSLVFGILQHHGYFPNLDATMQSHWPAPFVDAPEKASITLRQLLTMRSGIDFDNDVFSVEMYVDGPKNPVEYILSKPMYAAPGEVFYYRDADPHLLSALVTHTTGKTVASWASEFLFAPLGIQAYFWGEDEGGNSMGAHGLYLKPRDLLKTGQLLLDAGASDGVQVVPEEWIAQATSMQVDTTGNGFDFGYYYWMVPRFNAFTTWGHGGNFIFVAPDQNVVILLLSLPDTDDDTVGTLLPEFLPMVEVILNACH